MGKSSNSLQMFLLVFIPQVKIETVKSIHIKYNFRKASTLTEAIVIGPIRMIGGTTPASSVVMKAILPLRDVLPVKIRTVLIKLLRFTFANPIQKELSSFHILGIVLTVVLHFQGLFDLHLDQTSPVQAVFQALGAQIGYPAYLSFLR